VGGTGSCLDASRAAQRGPQVGLVVLFPSSACAAACPTTWS